MKLIVDPEVFLELDGLSDGACREPIGDAVPCMIRPGKSVKTPATMKAPVKTAQLLLTVRTALQRHGAGSRFVLVGKNKYAQSCHWTRELALADSVTFQRDPLTFGCSRNDG
jgi:hypothetical protein